MKSLSTLHVFFGILLALTLSLSVFAQDTTPPEKPEKEKKTINILFVGNSYTLANFPAFILEELSKAAKVDQKIRVDMVVEGSTSFQDHWEKTDARKTIAAHPWTYVVLQERSFYPIQQPDLMMKYGQLLDGDIKKAKAKTIFFETWPEKSRQSDQKAIHEAYTRLGTTCEALVAPAGNAMYYVLKDKPNFLLHEDDGRHESQKGAYLVACVFFATIYKQSPVGLPGRLKVKDNKGREVTIADLSDEDAVLLQKAAWTTVEHFKSYDPLKKEVKK